MARVQQEDIIKMNDLYLKYKTYAEVARQTGFSASTVKKYIDKDYSKVKTVTLEEKIAFSKEMREKMDADFNFTLEELEQRKNLELNYEEYKGIEELWKEMQI